MSAGRSAWPSRLDSVVMLTWSDWKSEPRSNRYHYATRFARHVPVLFVQPDGEAQLEEPSSIANLTLLHVGAGYSSAQLGAAANVLSSRGLARPLVWAYNPNFTAVEKHFKGALRVFHATEDYFGLYDYIDQPGDASRYQHRIWSLRIQRRLMDAVQASDLVVAVSSGVADSIRARCSYDGPLLILENGCDYAFWSAGSRPTGRAAKPVAIYQGGINERLDTALIVETMRGLPDWQFQFCGTVSRTYRGWQDLQREPNFQYLGILSPERLRDALYSADVALIPYLQVPIFTRQSLPLKAFEYAACGLPVVTVPIESLGRLPDVFRFARTVDEFVAAIRADGATRHSADRLAARRAAARSQDYELRFAELLQALRELQPRKRKRHTGVLFRQLKLAAAEFWNRAVLKLRSAT